MSNGTRLSRRSLLKLAVASAGAAALSACAAATPGGQQAGGSAPAESGAPAAASGEAVQLEYYFATGGAPKNVEVMQGLFARFTEAHPEITVEPVVAPQGVTSAQKLQTMVAGGVPLDLVYTGASVSFAARGVYLDLFPLLEKAGRSLEDQHPNARAVYTIKGGSFLWGLPNHLSGHFLCVQDLFTRLASPSQRWAETGPVQVPGVADAVTQRDGDTATAGLPFVWR